MLVVLLLAALLAQQPAPPQPPAPALDYDFYKARVQPLFLEKRLDHARCVTCHAGSTTLRLQRLSPGAEAWTEEQTRQNFEAAMAMVVPGSPGASKLLRHPLARAAGGDVFHGGGQHWTSKDDPDWQVLSAWVNGATLASSHDTRARAHRPDQCRRRQHPPDRSGHQQGDGSDHRHRSAARRHVLTRRPAALLHQRVAAHPRRGRCADAGGRRPHSPQRAAEQRGDWQGRQACLRRHCPGAGRSRRHRYRVAHQREVDRASRARSTTSTSRPTGSSSSRDRSPAGC